MGFVDEPLASRKSPRRKSETGTRVTAWPDPKYFDSPVIPVSQLVRLLRSKAVLMPGCEVIFHNEIAGTDQRWLYEGGLGEYLASKMAFPPAVPRLRRKGLQALIPKPFLKARVPPGWSRGRRKVRLSVSPM